MSAGEWAILLLAVSVVLFLGELVLPTHGVVGLLGLLALGGSIGTCFWINQWLGLGVFLGAVIAAPFVMTLLVNLWPKTPVGRGLLLRPVDEAQPPLPSALTLGQSGRAISELKPGGECEFGEQRVEAVSEHGIIPAGQAVKIVALVGGRPVVRPLPPEPQSA